MMPKGEKNLEVPVLKGGQNLPPSPLIEKRLPYLPKIKEYLSYKQSMNAKRFHCHYCNSMVSTDFKAFMNLDSI